MLSLKQWLEKFGQEPCDGCPHFKFIDASCNYRSRFYCARYESYVRDFKSYPELDFDYD